MEFNSAVPERLKAIISNPSLAGPEDAALLAEAGEAFPYFKVVHLLRAKITGNSEDIQKAVLYSSGNEAYDFLHTPGTALHLTVPQEQDQEGSLHAVSEDDQPDEIYEEIEELNTETFEFLPVERHASHQQDQGAELKAQSLRNELPTPSSQLPTPNSQLQTSNSKHQTHLPLPPPEIETVTPDEPEHQVSRYDDDNLPYTFLWWLAKTRAEHSQIFQPYAALKKPLPGELQHQYAEHIFHLQTGVEEGGLADRSDSHHKDHEIIDAFIEKDPQIKPPAVNKLDNENKARKSAEDHNDVVSETLAAIYIEQLLFRKAIDTYEKLSLKFPEKSRYFADLIRSLEKKL